MKLPQGEVSAELMETKKLHKNDDMQFHRMCLSMDGFEQINCQCQSSTQLHGAQEGRSWEAVTQDDWHEIESLVHQTAIAHRKSISQFALPKFMSTQVKLHHQLMFTLLDGGKTLGFQQKRPIPQSALSTHNTFWPQLSKLLRFTNLYKSLRSIQACNSGTTSF